MPIIAESLFEAVQKALDSIIDSLRGTVHNLETATDAHRLLERVKPLFDDLSRLGADLTPVDPADAFLAHDGVAPQGDQLSIDDFAQAIVNAVAQQWTPALTAAIGPIATAPLGGAGGTLAGQIAAFFRSINPYLDPEVWIRFAVNLERAANAVQAAEHIAEHVITAAQLTAMAEDSAWADTPMDDDTKEAEEPAFTKPPAAIARLQAMLTSIPGADGPRDRFVGIKIHRKLMERYAMEHPDHLVLVDGTTVINVDNFRLQLSRLLTPQGQLLQDSHPQLMAFANVMRDPTQPPPGRRVHPDIADMEPRATKPTDDWGWFEIKPMGRLVTAVMELSTYYLELWNGEVALNHNDWVKQPGAWQPTEVGVTGTYAFVAATALPGAIGYLTYNLVSVAEAAAAVIITTLCALFARRLLATLTLIAAEARLAADAVSEYLLAWVLLVAMLVALALAAVALIPEEVLTGAAAALAALIARLSSISLSPA